MFTTKYKSHSQTLKSILGITQIINKAYQVNKFNQNRLICTISLSDLFTKPKGAGVCIRSHNLLCNVLHFFPFNLIICNIIFFRIFFDPLTPFRGIGYVRGQSICLHGVLNFIPVNLICNMTTFRKENHFDPTPGVKGKSKGKLFASMLLYASFPLI